MSATDSTKLPDPPELKHYASSWDVNDPENAAHTDPPLNNFVTPLLTDLYQISMAYAYWHSKRHETPSVFDLFFRKNPFGGEFTIFGGLEEALRFIANFKFSDDDLKFLSSKFPQWEPEFLEYLAKLDTSQVKVYAVKEGTVVFPREPLMRIEGPVGICQLLETTLLNCVNFPSLICTNAARHRLAAGPKKKLVEFGLRRAQGPDGAMSASKYAVAGGFDGTSNVLAGKMFGISITGTHAHSFVVSYSSLGDIGNKKIKNPKGEPVEFVSVVLKYRETLKATQTNEGELAAFIAYAQAYPDGFLALIDTYDTLESGVLNFLCVALALHELGYKPIGIRLDSGDLAFLSQMCRKKFREIAEEFNVPAFASFNIVASNDLSESVIHSLNEQKHDIDTFGIGTHLVTCQSQPALGCVYKLVEMDGKPRIKLSQEIAKVTIPGRKEVYRLYGKDHQPLLDVMVTVGETPPAPQTRMLCRHPFDANKRVYVTPTSVEQLHHLVWDGKMPHTFPTIEELRTRVGNQLAKMRSDHLRFMNPTPYKLSITNELYTFMHDLWLNETPIHEVS